jgi:hypothetical protein
MAIVVSPLRHAAGDALVALHELYKLISGENQLGGLLNISAGVLKWRDCLPHWQSLQNALESAGSAINTPPPDDGLAALWLRVICHEAAGVAERARQEPGGYYDLLIQEDEGLFWLALTAPIVGFRLLNFAGHLASNPFAAILGLPKRKSAADQLRKLANRVESWWNNQPALPPRNDSFFVRQDIAEHQRQELERSLSPYAQEAGTLILEAINQGALPDDGLFDSCLLQTVSAGNERIDGEYLFRRLVQAWLPYRMPSHGGGPPDQWQYPGVERDASERYVEGIRFARCMTAIAELLEGDPMEDCHPTKSGIVRGSSVVNPPLEIVGRSAPEVYEYLLCQFRHEFGSRNPSTIILQLFDEKELSVEQELHPQDIIYCGATVLEHKLAPIGEKCSSWCDSFRVVCIPFDFQRNEEYLETVRADWGAFSILAQQAGAHLPGMIRDAMPGCLEQPLGAWLKLMFLTLRPHINIENAYSGRCNLTHIPFSAAADVIEQCRLNSSAPILPHFCKLERIGSMQYRRDRPCRERFQRYQLFPNCQTNNSSAKHPP